MLPKIRHREKVGASTCDILGPVYLCVYRALEVWGSWQVLEHELNRRRQLAEEEERRRKGLGALIAQLKKYNKAQTRREIDVQVCQTLCVC